MCDCFPCITLDWTATAIFQWILVWISATYYNNHTGIQHEIHFGIIRDLHLIHRMHHATVL